MGTSISQQYTLTVVTVYLLLLSCHLVIRGDNGALPVPLSADNGEVNIAGDFIIGAMFPIHALTGGGRCGSAINDQNGMQNLEALLYSRKRANEDILKDRGINMGVLALDTCGSDTVALDMALNFVKLQTYILGMESMFKCKDGSSPTFTQSGKLIGVVGAATSAVSIQLANFLRLFRIPQISYSATSPELSDTTRYDYFMRTVASDEYQAKAIVEVLKTFDWNYVVGIYEDTSYGNLGFAEIEKHAVKSGICIGKSYKVNRYFQTNEEKIDEVEHIVNDSLQFNNTAGKIVVILYASEDIVSDIFSLVDKHNIGDKFVWIGSDAWTGRKFDQSYQYIADHALGVQPKIKEIQEFDDYFKSLTLRNNKTNPWFEEYWEQTFGCIYTTKKPIRNTEQKYCTGKERFSEKDGTYKRNKNTYAVMDAVYAFAYALKELHKDKCGNINGICDQLKNTEAEHLKKYLDKVKFKDIAGLEFQFNGNSGPARYSVMQYIDTDNGYSWREVDDCLVNINTGHDDEQWFDNLQILKSSYQPSHCSLPCKQGQAKLLHVDKCCWTCETCLTHQYLQIHNQSCLNCSVGQRSNSSHTGCEDIPEMYMDIYNIWAIISIVFTCIGVIVTSLVAGVFCWQRQTPLIMASGKELSFVLLLGILLSYLSTFAFVAYPTAISCGLTRTLLGMCYTLCYAAILVKTNRIYRVFNINSNNPEKVKFIGAKSQLLITFTIVSVEIVALITWFVVDPPKETHFYPSLTEKIRLCQDAMDFSYLGALAYPLLLMILCVYYAIRTRKTPDGFNETRYITFGSYSFCVLWIAFISIYFSVHNNTIRIVSLCFASTINATVTLITLFITKTYVVILRPQKNTRENVMARRRTHTYDSVNISRMASAASTWHSVNTRFDSEDSQHQTITISQKPNFGHKLSVSVVSMNNFDQSDDSMYSNHSSTSAPPVHRRLTTEELMALSAPFKQSSTDLGDQRLKQFIEKSQDEDCFELQNGIRQMVPRRSMRSFKSKRKRRRTIKRSRSLDCGNDLRVPNIVVTSSSQEDNSVTVVKL